VRRPKDKAGGGREQGGRMPSILTAEVAKVWDERRGFCEKRLELQRNARISATELFFCLTVV